MAAQPVACGWGSCCAASTAWLNSATSSAAEAPAKSAAHAEAEAKAAAEVWVYRDGQRGVAVRGHVGLELEDARGVGQLVHAALGQNCGLELVVLREQRRGPGPLTKVCSSAGGSSMTANTVPARDGPDGPYSPLLLLLLLLLRGAPLRAQEAAAPVLLGGGFPAAWRARRRRLARRRQRPRAPGTPRAARRPAPGLRNPSRA